MLDPNDSKRGNVREQVAAAQLQEREARKCLQFKRARQWRLIQGCFIAAAKKLRAQGLYAR